MRGEEAMKTDDESWSVLLDPGYSILGLPHAPGRNGVRYLDVVTGWQRPRPVSPTVAAGPRRDRLK
jgi:hypothetical protein